MTEYLEIVNENDEVVGKETRERIHRDGLLHREVHVWFVTPNKEIIFQHRAKDKDTWPNLLDATVGGHVDPGMNYENTAIKETFEETGLKILKDDLVFLKKMHKNTKDSYTDTINNAFKIQYGYVFKGNLSDLQVERGKAIGFESWKIERLFSLSDEEKKRFIPSYYSNPEYFELYKQLENLT